MKKIPVRQIAESNNESSHFSIRALQDVMGGKDLKQDVHRHDFYFVLVVEKGRGIHEIDFVKYDIHNHSVFILRPGQVHQLALKAGSSGYIMEFDLSFYQAKKSGSVQWFRKSVNKNYCRVEEKKFKKILECLKNIFDEFSMKYEAYSEAIKANLDIFFIEYMRQSSEPRKISKNISSHPQEKFEELLAQLESKISETKSPSDYAKRLNLSIYQLNSISKTMVGKSVSDLITDQIILEAKRQLLATNNQIKDIAWHLGYEDTSYFIRFFKKHTGKSPESFRRDFK